MTKMAPTTEPADDRVPPVAVERSGIAWMIWVPGLSVVIAGILALFVY